MTHIQVYKATQLDGESPLLNSVADDLGDQNSKLVYADWLEEHGDQNRAKFLRKYVAAFESMNLEDFPDLDSVPAPWAKAIGATLVHGIVRNDVAQLRDQLLAVAKPSLVYEFDSKYNPIEDPSQFEVDPTIPIGGSKLFGLPDLPPGTVWPRQRDCNTYYMEDAGIDPETICSFVCQINLAELAGTQAARLCPKAGLISIFSCSEIESIGMVDAFVQFIPESELGILQRLSPPEEIFSDEANQLFDAASFKFTEALVTPYPSDVSPFAVTKLEYDDSNYDALSELIRQVEDESLSSFLGYTRATSGDDPLPGEEWCKLICIENSIEMRLHFCIKTKDLAAGKFDDLQLAFVDFD